MKSPQQKFLTDNIEDTTYCPTYYSSNLSSFKFDYKEQNEVIAEDNNENICEKIETKRSHSSKKIENFFDKSEAFDDQANKKVSEIIIEPIKEENIEEDEVIQTNFYQNKGCEYPISDELHHKDTRLKYRLSMKKFSFEENKIINELDDDF